MTLEARKKAEPILFWMIAMIILPLGVCFSAKSQFGVSMIEAPVYTLHLKISEFFPWYTFGTSEYVLQATLLIAMCIVIRRFKWKYLLSFMTAFLNGLVLDGWNFVFGGIPADTMLSRIIFAILGCAVTALAIAFFFRTDLPLAVWELFVKEISDKFKLNIAKFKWIYDISSLTVGIILMFICFGRFRLDVIGIGTIIITFINAPLIGFFGKMIDLVRGKTAK